MGQHTWPCVCLGVFYVGGSFLCTHPATLQAKNERNYHIFYELLAGLPAQLRQAFSLQEAETYYYLNQVSSAGVRGPPGLAPLPHHPGWAERTNSWCPNSQQRQWELGAMILIESVSS